MAFRTAFTVLVTLVLLVLLWEGYKWMGQQTDDHWPGTQFGLPVHVIARFSTLITYLERHSALARYVPAMTAYRSRYGAKTSR